MHRKLAILIGCVAVIAASPLIAQQRGDEPIPVPRSIRQGIDFVYVDPQLSSVARRRQRPQNWLQRIFGFNFGGSRDRPAPNPLFVQLGQGLQRYQTTWGRLPQVRIPAGPTLKRGSRDKRVDLLRTRLGLPAGGGYDERLFEAVATYQTVHGVGPADGIAGRSTIASLNRGADYYARRIAINVERAWRLPPTRTFDRYVVVDSGAAEAYLFVGDRVVDAMKVIVGSPKTKTPMMAVLMRDAKANPYWNVPPELVRSLTAKRIAEQGLSYLKNFHYEVLSDWGPNAQVIDPRTVDWKAIASGRMAPTVHVRQLPGPWNSMRNMKFEMPNDYGIYLHDTPHMELFAKNDRWLSNGCVRLEDYKRVAKFLFNGNIPRGDNPKVEKEVDLPTPIPVYMTYLTVQPTADGVQFLEDHYGRDAHLMERYGSQLMAAVRGQ